MNFEHHRILQEKEPPGSRCVVMETLKPLRTN